MKAWPPIIIADATPVASPELTWPGQRMGEMLHSAITRGALLDSRWWGPWVRGVQDAIDLCDPHLAVDMVLDGQARRWFADPVTRLLIVRWHVDRLEAADGQTPLDHLAAFLPNPGHAPADLKAELLEDARATWRVRLPGALFAFATGDGLSVSVPRSNWLRIAHGWSVPEAPARLAEIAPAASKAKRPKADRIAMPVELAALNAEERDGDGADQRRKAKAAAADRIEALRPIRPGAQQALRGWMVHALRHQRGTGSLGFEPSTVDGYLRLLGGIFYGWVGCSPLDADPRTLAAFIDARLPPGNEKMLKAAQSFVRFYNSQRSDDLLELEEDDARVSEAVSAKLITPAEYRRALARLDRKKDADGALLLILGFRAGLRIEEAGALRVSDIIEAKGALEVVLEKNDERTLKTPTSRRILPLDVLLDPDERERLVQRAEVHRAAAGAIGRTWLLGPLGAALPPDWKSAAKRVDAALAHATGSPGTRFRHLRHSFASYLIATLLLPLDVDRPAVPHELAPVVSRARHDRVANRLLGQQRLGAGAIHTVSQLLGHTGPGTTLRSYCHLLDLMLGLYVGRASTLPRIDGGQISALLDVTRDARRKAAERHGKAAQIKPAEQTHTRPDRPLMERYTPGSTGNAAHVRLLASQAQRLARPLRRAMELEIERAAVSVHPNELARARREPASESKPRPPRPSRPKPPPHVVPWRLVAAMADERWPDDGTAGVATDQVERWRKNVARLRDWRSTPLRFASPMPAERGLRHRLDGLLTLPRPPLRAERNALNSALLSMRRHRGQIRLKQLGEARSFVGLLRVMGFHDAEVMLSISNKSEARFPSARVHRWLRGEEHIPEITGRSGWRGSLVIQFRPRDKTSPRAFAQACRFALVMLAIDAPPVARARPAMDRKSPGTSTCAS